MCGSEHTGVVNRGYTDFNGGVMTWMVCGEVKFFMESCERHTHQPSIESAFGGITGQRMAALAIAPGTDAHAARPSALRAGCDLEPRLLSDGRHRVVAVRHGERRLG